MSNENVPNCEKVFFSQIEHHVRMWLTNNNDSDKPEMIYLKHLLRDLLQRVCDQRWICRFPTANDTELIKAFLLSNRAHIEAAAPELWPIFESLVKSRDIAFQNQPTRPPSPEIKDEAKEEAERMKPTVIQLRIEDVMTALGVPCKTDNCYNKSTEDEDMEIESKDIDRERYNKIYFVDGFNGEVIQHVINENKPQPINIVEMYTPAIHGVPSFLQGVVRQRPQPIVVVDDDSDDDDSDDEDDIEEISADENDEEESFIHRPRVRARLDLRRVPEPTPLKPKRDESKKNK